MDKTREALEREQFERMWLERGIEITERESFQEMCWLVWQARAALAAEPPQPEAQPVAVFIDANEGISGECSAFLQVQPGAAAYYKNFSQYHLYSAAAPHLFKPESEVLTDERIVSVARGAGLSEFIGFDRVELGKELRQFACAIERAVREKK